MDPELRAVLDRQEIIDVSIRYATALDTCDWDCSAAASCPTPSVSTTPSGTLRAMSRPTRDTT